MQYNKPEDIILNLRKRIHNSEQHNQYFERCESAWCNPSQDNDPAADNPLGDRARIVTTILESRLLNELRNYAENQKRNVAQGAQTPEVAALLLEKYGYGLAKAIQLADLPQINLIEYVHQLTLEIDPHFLDRNWQRRYVCAQ